ncbi:MAG: hypothetical protein K5769_03445 [Pseudobutyrivibrio sp.]|nr:hypothetical protein [Pseudobutyrivibrio sp.]
MMKKLINGILALCIGALVTVSQSIVASAEDGVKTEYSWNVTYKGTSGNAFESTYDVNKANLSGVMPGDTVVYTAQYTNATDKSTDFYLSTEVFSSLEDTPNVSSQGGAYTFKIENQGPNGNQILFNNIVGGDSSTVDPVGLKQLNTDGNSYFSLGSIAPGASGKIIITVKVDGNSQDNSYMSTLARLSVVFAAQSTDDANGGKKITNDGKRLIQQVVKSEDGGTEVVIIDEEIPTSGENPITGDSMFPLLMCAICLVVGLVFILWYFKLTREQKEEA